MFKNLFKRKQKLDSNLVCIDQINDLNEIKYHFIFHIYCIDHEKVHYAIEKLRHSLHIFNGYKIITVSSPNNNFHDNHIFQKIVDIFKFNNIYIIPVNNSSDNKESQHFFYRSAPLMANLIRNESNKSFIFFGHSKGCSHDEKNYGVTCWVNTLWKYNIDLFYNSIKPKIEKFENIDFIGCLRTTEDCKFNSKFHYAGTFFWFNGDILKTDKWHIAHDHLLSLEMWPGLVSTIDKSISLFDCEQGDKYRYDFWYNLVFEKKVDRPHTIGKPQQDSSLQNQSRS